MNNYKERIWYVDPLGNRFYAHDKFIYEISYSRISVVIPILLHWHYAVSPCCLGYKLTLTHTLENKSVIIEERQLIAAPVTFLLNNNFIRE